MRLGTATVALAAVLVLSTLPVIAAQGPPEVPPPPSQTLEAVGAFDDQARFEDATLSIHDGLAQLTVDTSGDPVSDAFPVTWSKDNVGPQQAAWVLQIQGTGDTLGELDLTGTWQAATYIGLCTADYPTSGCMMYATGPAELAGTLGGETITFAGVAFDTYCMQGHAPLNELTACGDRPLTEPLQEL